MVEVVGGWVSTPPHEAMSLAILFQSDSFLRVGDPEWSCAPSGGGHVRKLSCDAQGDLAPLPCRCTSTYLLQLCALYDTTRSTSRPILIDFDGTRHSRDRLWLLELLVF